MKVFTGLIKISKSNTGLKYSAVYRETRPLNDVESPIKKFILLKLLFCFLSSFSLKINNSYSSN